MVTGSKNVKLICMRDDNPIIELNEIDEDPHLTTPKISLATSQTQTELGSKTDNGKKHVKISRLPKSNRKTLKMLPKQFILNVIQYKLDYYKYCKSNPMYKKASRPWEMLGRFSDQILDELFMAVTCEMEVNEILNSLYQAEFQL